MDTYWTLPLAYSIEVRGVYATELSTLADAAAFLSEHTEAIKRSAPLEYAVELVLKAAETGAADDRLAATRQLEVFLRSQQWL